MVEFKAEGMSRETTPVAITQSSKSSLGESLHTLGDAGPSQGDRVSESHFTRPCSLFHEQNSLIPFTSTEHTQPYDEGASTPPDSMPGDASNESTPVRNRSRANNRRRPFVSGGAGRPSAGPPSVSSPSHGYFPPVSSSNDNSTPHNSFQPSVIQFPTSPHPFSQGGGYYGQYTVPSHPPSLNIGQPHHAYSYPPHPFQSPQQVSDSNNRVTSPQLTYSQQPLYHYPQQHRSNDGPNPSVSFSNQMSSESVFSPTFPSTNPTNDMAGVNAATPQYMGPLHLSGMGYPSSLRSPQYGYPPATVYRPYSAVSYQPHLSPSVEDLHKGSWYFVPHTPQSQQHPYEQYRQGYSYQYQPPAQQRESSSHVSRHPSSASAPPRTHLSEPKFPSALQPGSPPLTASRSSIAGRDSPSSSGQPSTTSKPVVRREWHPRPPAHRSPWVMWVGNVPSDATQEELWRFFTHPPETGNAHTTLNAGVESIFLIGRSNCAFINYSSESSVSSAIQTFNGKRLRPNDPQCPMLVCKIRRSTDDLKSGVGGQRGIGLHKQWIQSQRMQKCQASGSSDIEASEGNSGSDADHFPSVLSSVSISSGDRRKDTHSSSSDSHASTTSSFLAEYFPTRFFILKSLSEDDLALSVQNGLWATQKHNELLLDQAFRTAKDVFLIFSVNKSGEFYGYARMTGPIRRGEGTVTWASRSDGSFPSPSGSTTSPRTNRFKANTDTKLLSGSPQPKMFFSPDGGHVVDESPLQLDDLDDSPRPSSSETPLPPRLLQQQSAPPKIGGGFDGDEGPQRTPSLKFSLDHHQRKKFDPPREAFELDPEAPIRAVRAGMHDPPGPQHRDGKAKSREVEEPKLDRQQDGEAPSTPGWGECFKIEWLELRRIPFHRTRHLRNPWNKGREIKISRDGTELEPTIGKKLLDEWGTLAEA